MALLRPQGKLVQLRSSYPKDHLSIFFQFTFFVLLKKLISGRTCLALTERNTLNPKHNTKTSLRNLLMCWAVNSIIAMTNANFPEKTVSSVGQFINESYCTVFMSLCKSYAMPVKQILTTKRPTKTLKSDTIKTKKNSKVWHNKKKGYEPQTLPSHWFVFAGIVLGRELRVLFLVWW